MKLSLWQSLFSKNFWATIGDTMVPIKQVNKRATNVSFRMSASDMRDEKAKGGKRNHLHLDVRITKGSHISYVSN